MARRDGGDPAGTALTGPPGEWRVLTAGVRDSESDLG